VDSRELAFRFDLFIAPDWCERFDELATEHGPTVTEGIHLRINCGTGANAIAVAEAMSNGELVAVDACQQRLAIATAKAAASQVERCRFVTADATDLQFENATFDSVVCDASREQPDRLREVIGEAARVAKPQAPVLLLAATRGSFDEFFSVYWEALNDVGLVEELWPLLEPLITARPTTSELAELVKKAGVTGLQTHGRKEEWRFESGQAFFESALVEDLLLHDWLAIVPAERLPDVREAIARVIDRERGQAYFYITAKAVAVTGVRKG
jgi:ubiquinone/menaquinone biosynthesis C-methylase UbiE